MIYYFTIHMEPQPLSWKEVYFETILIDWMEMQMALVMDLNHSPCLLESFL
jgi:hypothetical protein